MLFEATHISETKSSCLDHIHLNFVPSRACGGIAAEIADLLPVSGLVFDPKCSLIRYTIEIRDLKKN